MRQNADSPTVTAAVPRRQPSTAGTASAARGTIGHHTGPPQEIRYRWGASHRARAGCWPPGSYSASWVSAAAAISTGRTRLACASVSRHWLAEPGDVPRSRMRTAAAMRLADSARPGRR